MRKKHPKNSYHQYLSFFKSQTLETLFQELIFTCDSKGFILKLICSGHSILTH